MNIRLHRDKGVNPRVTVCIDCGEAIGVALLGANENKAICGRCGLVEFGGWASKPCPNCQSYNRRSEPILEHEKIPDGPCDKCVKERKLRAEIVAAGGVYFQCSDCHAQGVIRPCEFTEAFRKEHNIAAPKPVAVGFTKATGCPACGQDGSN